MSDNKTPRILQQQQPPRDTDAEQQQQGSTDFQSKKPAGQQQMGEGSYEATRDYQKGILDYLDKADVEADAEASKPTSEAEAREIEEAAREGKSHTKGER